MKDELEILKRLEKVAPPEHLLQDLLARLEVQNKNKVPTLLLSGIAAAFALLLVAEVVLITSQKHPKSPNQALAQILPLHQNTLYDE